MSRAEDLFNRLKDKGLEAIDDLIDDRQSEEFFLDFKRSGDRGVGRKLHSDDLNNLSKAISGFANSEGGLIIWGVDCRPDNSGADVAKFKFPVADAKGFKSKVDGKVSGCTIPPHENVQSIAIEENGTSGYVATLIPKNDSSPLYSVQRKNFYIRTGSSFAAAPPGVITGLLGKRPVPQPFLFFTFKQLEPPANSRHEFIDFKWAIHISHNGPNVLKDIYLNVKIAGPGTITKIESFFPEKKFWISNQIGNLQFSLVSKDGFRLAPLGVSNPIGFQFQTAPPYANPMKYTLTFGCEGSLVHRITKIIKPAELDELYTEIRNNEDVNFEKFLKSFFDIHDLSFLYK